MKVSLVLLRLAMWLTDLAEWVERRGAKPTPKADVWEIWIPASPPPPPAPDPRVNCRTRGAA